MRSRTSRISMVPSRSRSLGGGYSASHISRPLRSGLGIPEPSRPPMGPTYNFTDTLGKRCLTTSEMNRIQMCCPCPGDTPYVPSCICVQQTPRIVCRKNIVWVQKVRQEPTVVHTTRVVMVPRVVRVAKAVRIPEVTWTEGYVKVPRIEYRPTNVTTYDVKQAYKEVMGPQEICTTFLCRPKPQYVLIPPPTDYCCYPIDALNNIQATRPHMEANPYKLAFRQPEYMGPAYPIQPPQAPPFASQTFSGAPFSQGCPGTATSFSQNYSGAPFSQSYSAGAGLSPFSQSFPMSSAFNAYPNYSYASRNALYSNYSNYSPYSCGGGYYPSRGSRYGSFGSSMSGYGPIPMAA